MIIIIIIITFKDAVRDFCTIHPLRREPCPARTLRWLGRNRVQITCNTSGANHVQLVVLRATWYETTAQLLSLTEFKSHFFKGFILLAEPLTDEGGEETGVPGESLPATSLRVHGSVQRPRDLNLQPRVSADRRKVV